MIGIPDAIFRPFAAQHFGFDSLPTSHTYPTHRTG